MTYAVGGLIQANDYNTFASTGSPNVNDIWSVGSGNKGYGQPTLATVNIGDIVYAANWSGLFQAVVKSANHQGSTLSLLINDNPQPGDLVLFEPDLISNIAIINSNRLNAVSQSGTSFTSVTTTSSWTNYLSYTFNVTFSTYNAARYFFNAGGQIGFNASHPSGPGINTALNQLCVNVGTVWHSSPLSGVANLSGINYNGVTKIGGGAPAETIINTNLGFSGLNGSDQTLFQQDSASYYPYYYYPYYPYLLNTSTNLETKPKPNVYPYYPYYYYPYYGGNLFLRISGRVSGNTITYTVLVDSSSTSFINPGTTINMILRFPSTAYLTNSWGTPNVTTNLLTI